MDEHNPLTDYATAADAEKAHHAALAELRLAQAKRQKAAGDMILMAGLAILSSPAVVVVVAWLVTR